MNYEMARKAAMRGETVRRCAWVGGYTVRRDNDKWLRVGVGVLLSFSSADIAATDWVIVRKVPKSERDVFTHPRRGDVIEVAALGNLIDVLAVAPEGVLWRRYGVLVGETRAEFASRPNHGWTVKTRAPKKGKKS